MVDAHDSKSCIERCESSSLSSGTNEKGPYTGHFSFVPEASKSLCLRGETRNPIEIFYERSEIKYPIGILTL